MNAPSPPVTQWHITADDEVIRSSWGGEAGDRVSYVQYAPARRMELSDLHALDENAQRFMRTSDRRSNVLMVLLGVSVLGAAAGWLVLPPIGVHNDIAWVVLMASVLVFGACVAVASSMPRRMRRRFEGLYLDAGFESSKAHTLKAAQARPLIEAPGTISGPEVEVDRP